MNIIAIIIQLLCGAAGGNLAGSLFKNLSLGPIGNSLVGILGGGIGGQLLGMLGMGGGGAGGSMDIGSILGSIVSGGLGGGILMATIGFIKPLFGRGRLTR